jgi:hypothetical protein
MWQGAAMPPPATKILPIMVALSATITSHFGTIVTLRAGSSPMLCVVTSG